MESDFIVSQSPNLHDIFEFKFKSILDFRPLDLDFWAWQYWWKSNYRNVYCLNFAIYLWASEDDKKEILKAHQIKIVLHLTNKIVVNSFDLIND